MEQNNKRVRINLTESAKGLWQIDATAEFETVDEAATALSEAIDKAREILKQKGLQEASA
jgi:hypothetical protein